MSAPISYCTIRTIEKRAQFLDKRGASNLAEQQALIHPVIKLFKSYKLVVLGDREFHSVELAKWLLTRKIYFVFRQKQGTCIQMSASISCMRN
jgi:hypothetical protein